MVSVPYLPRICVPADDAVPLAPVDLLVTVVTLSVSELASVSLASTLPEPLIVAVMTVLVLVL